MNNAANVEQETVGIPWRCEKCGSTIAIVQNGSCIAPDCSTVTLRPDNVMVECPVCHIENVWVCNSQCKYS